MRDVLSVAAAFDQIRTEVSAALSDGLHLMRDDLRDALARDVEHIGNATVRSAPGENPRRETGALQESIATAVEVGLYGVDAVIYSDIPYSEYLEFGTARTLPRPHWARLYDRWHDRLPETVAHAVSARLP